MLIPPPSTHILRLQTQARDDLTEALDKLHSARNALTELLEVVNSSTDPIPGTARTIHQLQGVEVAIDKASLVGHHLNLVVSDNKERYLLSHRP